MMPRMPNRRSNIAEARRLYAEGFTIEHIARLLVVSKSWVHKYALCGMRHMASPCIRCGRQRPKSYTTSPLCYTCREAIRPREKPCQMVISPWQKLADGTMMRTVTGV